LNFGFVLTITTFDLWLILLASKLFCGSQLISINNENYIKIIILMSSLFIIFPFTK